MESNTKVIIDVTLNSQDSNAKAKELGASIKAIKEEQKQLKAAGKETDVAYQSNAANLRLLAQEQKAYIQMANAADGANHELSAQLTLLTQQYNAMGREERDNTVAGKALQVQIKNVSDELKGNKEAIGDHRMSVGDYEKANRSATAATAAQAEGINSLKDVIASIVPGFQGLTDQLSKTQNSFKNVVSSIKESNAAMKASKEATIASEAAKKEATIVNSRYAAGEATLTEVQAANTAATNASIVATDAQAVSTAAATNATKVLKVAMASTGIGALIVLAASLVSWLSKFKPLTDAIEQGVSGVSAAFEVLGNYVANITKPLMTVFTSPKKAMIDFSNFLLENVINRFKSFGVIIDAIRTGNLKKLSDGFIQMGSGVTGGTDKIINGISNFSKSVSQAAKEAANLTRQSQDLEDAERQSVSTLSKLRLERDRFAVQAKNTSLSEKERIALSEKANQKEKEAFGIESNLAKQRLKLTEAQVTAGKHQMNCRRNCLLTRQKSMI
jgi:chromosome segregation ATPase